MSMYRTSTTLFHFYGMFLFGYRAHIARDCRDIKDLGFYQSGVYQIIPEGTCKGFKVFCDMETDEGGWLVFQRRQDGSVDFYRGWEDYQFGFGNLTGEHWLGNLPLHAITRQGFYELRVDLTDWDGKTAFAKYRIFRIGKVEEKYKIAIAGYSGDAGNSFTHTNGQAFTTKDSDNDAWPENNCAVPYKGASWYDNCFSANLNGRYNVSYFNVYGEGVIWSTWRTYNYSLKATQMMIRRL